jgi:DNA-binding transcriptional LysR family regulator
MIRLDDVQLFVQTADAGSFSAAARLSAGTPAMVSNAVQRLERELGVRLFVRSTRSMRLSDDGERYLPHARAMLDSVASGSRALAEGRGEVTGPLRLAVPSDLGRNVLLPLLDAFQAQHPAVALQLRISDRTTDLHRHPIDAAVRYGVLEDSTLVAQPLLPDNRRVVCASPDYVARHGAPSHPDDLRAHNCLCFVWGDQVHDRWVFDLPRGPHAIKVAGNRVSDDGEVTRRWGLAGRGIVYKSHADVAADLAAGRLIDLMPGLGERSPLNLVSAHRSQLTPAVQRLRDFLREHLSRLAGLPQAEAEPQVPRQRE